MWNPHSCYRMSRKNARFREDIPLAERKGVYKMVNYLSIEKVYGREILDSRGNPTVEAEIHLAVPEYILFFLFSE